MRVHLGNLTKQMEETANQIGSELPVLAEMIEEWAKAVEDLRQELSEAADTKSAREDLESAIEKAVAAAKGYQIYESNP